jgi:hypothetical protein
LVRESLGGFLLRIGDYADAARIVSQRPGQKQTERTFSVRIDGESEGQKKIARLRNGNLKPPGRMQTRN